MFSFLFTTREGVAVLSFFIALSIFIPTRVKLMESPEAYSRAFGLLTAMVVFVLGVISFYYESEEMPDSTAVFGYLLTFVALVFGFLCMLTAGYQWLREQAASERKLPPSPSVEQPRVAEPPAEYKVKEPTPEEKLDEILRRNRRE